MPVGSANLPSTDATALQVTKVGRLIRRFSIDELPQLLNNPGRRDERRRAHDPPSPTQSGLLELRRASGALGLRPGLTGLAQVNSYDGMPIAEKAAVDADYARRTSLLLDLSIIARTVGYLFRRPPVY